MWCFFWYLLACSQAFLSGMLKYFDFFGEKFNMKLDKKNETLTTTAGSLITIIVYLVIFMYAYI